MSASDRNGGEALNSYSGGTVRVGDVLNGIFEVRRFIDRGGMGEVFEGFNVKSPSQRVAIKVILPSLAADPRVREMFFREAEALTYLVHEALVHYRFITEEERLGVLYIVTDYIEGVDLSKVLGQVPRDGPSLIALTRRLASGLREAHRLGIVHRDVSPDNIRLEKGELAGAKILDFGIAKDLDPEKVTIVGDGFAGKLRYVSPEQFGAYGKKIGRWSDVYSLGLVILAVARGQELEMGNNYAEALDIRRAGIDVSDAPAVIQPVLAAMLVADPEKRLASMDAVLAELARAELGDIDELSPVREAQPGPRSPPKSRPLAQWVAEARAWVQADSERKLYVLAGACLLALLVAVLAVAISLGFSGSGPEGAIENQAGAEAPPAPVRSGPGESEVRALAQRAADEVDCSWLTVDRVRLNGNAASISISGVAGMPGNVSGEIARALGRNGIQTPGLATDAILPVEDGNCVQLNAFRKVRDYHTVELATDLPSYSLLYYAEVDKIEAHVTIKMHLKGAPQVALITYETQNGSKLEAAGKEAFDQLVKDDLMATAGDGRYNLVSYYSQKGLHAFIVVSGDPPFDRALLTPQSPGPQWSTDFAAAARDRHWKVNMIWFTVQDAASQ